MSLTKLSVPVADEQQAELLSNALSDMAPGPQAISTFRDGDATPQGWRVEAYYQAEDAAHLASALESLALPFHIWPALETVGAANWVALSQAALPPVAARPFLVHGSHDRSRADNRRYAIEIEAGEAFGTAYHASTRGCLIALGQLARRSHRFGQILDLGCGSGILAIAAVKALPAASAVASDIDHRAVAVARTNAVINRVAGRISTAVAAGLAHPHLRRRFDLVLANILAEPLITLAPHIARSLQRGGYLILAGILAEEARRVAAAYTSAGFIQRRKLNIEGWATLVLQRSGPPRAVRLPNRVATSTGARAVC